MPKLDLYNALQIKAAGGEVLQLKGPGFSWSKPTALTPYYRSGAIGIHLRSNGATPAGGPVTAIANEGAAGALFNASIIGNPVPLTGNYLESSTATGYPITANPADLVGVRLMWVMRMNVATGTYRFFGRSEGSDTLYIRTNNGTSIQMFRVVGGVSATATFTGIAATTAPRLLEIETTASAARLFINGLLHQEVAIAFPTFRIDRITQGPTSLQAFEGGMGDVLGVVTGRADTDAAIAVARDYLAQRFGIALAGWTPVVPVDGGPNVGATSFRGVVTQNGDGSYRVTSAPGNTNGRALINMPELAAGVQVVLETSLRYDDATRIILRQVENNDSVGGTTIFDLTRPSVGAVITRSDTYSVITSRRNLHYIGVSTSGQYFTINPQTRYRVL